MKKILFQGDSITDAIRVRDNDNFRGSGYPTLVSGKLGFEFPNEYEVGYNQSEARHNEYIDRCE